MSESGEKDFLLPEKVESRRITPQGRVQKEVSPDDLTKDRLWDKEKYQGAWVARSVKHPTSAQVMISRSVSLSPRRALC